METLKNIKTLTKSWFIILMLGLFIAEGFAVVHDRKVYRETAVSNQSASQAAAPAETMPQVTPPTSNNISPSDQEIHWGSDSGSGSMTMTSRTKLIPTPDGGMMPALPGPGTVYIPEKVIKDYEGWNTPETTSEQRQFVHSMYEVFAKLIFIKAVLGKDPTMDRDTLWPYLAPICGSENGVGFCGTATEDDIPVEVKEYIMAPINEEISTGTFDSDIANQRPHPGQSAVNASMNRWLYITGGCCQEGHMDPKFQN